MEYLIIGQDKIYKTMEERYDEYDLLKEQIFKAWSAVPPQMPLTKEQYERIKNPTAPQIPEDWFI